MNDQQPFMISTVILSIVCLGFVVGLIANITIYFNSKNNPKDRVRINNE